MKILITSHRFAPDIGGIETISELLAESFVKAGHSVRLLTQSLDMGSQTGKSFPFTIVRQPSKIEIFTCYCWADVILQNNIEARLLWPNLLLRKPLVIGLQTWISTVNGPKTVFHRLKNAMLSLADFTIACSEAIRKECCPTATVIGNPYNADLFRNISGISRVRDVVFLGRLVSDKGVDLLLEAIARFSPPRPNLTIIGIGPEQTKLEQRVRDLHIEDSVCFTGPLQGEELVHVLNAHQVMVVPSLWQEPFGVVALEGIACGCVPLASDGGGLPDAVGPTGMLFQRGNVESLYQNLHRLLVDTVLRDQLRANASTHLLRFEPEAVASHYLFVLAQARQRT